MRNAERVRRAIQERNSIEFPDFEAITKKVAEALSDFPCFQPGFVLGEAEAKDILLPYTAMQSIAMLVADKKSGLKGYKEFNSAKSVLGIDLRAKLEILLAQPVGGLAPEPGVVVDRINDVFKRIDKAITESLQAQGLLSGAEVGTRA
jgi:hypothetical protein